MPLRDRAGTGSVPGGLRAHRAALPLFLGLLAGHATAYTLQRLLLMVLEVRVG